MPALTDIMPTGHPIQDAHRAYVAAHHAAALIAPDLLDFSFAYGAIRLAAGWIERFMQDADECGAALGPTLRAHMPELRLIAAQAVALLAKAEEEAV